MRRLHCRIPLERSVLSVVEFSTRPGAFAAPPSKTALQPNLETRMNPKAQAALLNYIDLCGSLHAASDFEAYVLSEHAHTVPASTVPCSSIKSSHEYWDFLSDTFAGMTWDGPASK